MNDLDFDELDEAVKSVLGDTQDDTPHKQPSAPSATNDGATRRGRFMDVVARPVANNLPDRTNTVRSRRADELNSKPTRIVNNVVKDDEPAKASDDSSKAQTSNDTKTKDEIPAPDFSFLDKYSPQANNSPFLEDLKVEKRPLGGFAESETVTEDHVSYYEKNGKATETVVDATEVEASDGQLPEELSGAVMKVESGDGLDPEVVEKALQDNAAALSIFDSDAYQPAVKHPAKQHNGWLAAVLIILVVAMGVAAAVAVYYIAFAK